MLTKERLESMGLKSGSIRNKQVVHNGGWYNSNGVKIGWGDLSQEDFTRIQENLLENELFVVLREYDSFWCFVTHCGPVGWLCKTSSQEPHPGQDYVVEHAIFVIARDKVHCISRFSSVECMSDLELAALIKDAK